MCGIVAIYHPQGCVSSEPLSRATACLHHRGPDGRRQWVAPHGRVGLGHARLSIIDLVTGDQPIVNEDGRRHIVVNGEFYDFERIQGELTRAVYRRQKHPFLSPPATLNLEDRLHEMVQDVLRGSALGRVPFVDRNRVVRLLDALPSLELGEQVSMDQVLMMLLSACELGARFDLGA